ncbi:hypothetical protein [Methanothrix sp.]|jgi:hypothetical protein
MEVKEHIFIFLPIIALSITLAILDLFMVLLMFLMGAIVSNAGNVRLEA